MPERVKPFLLLSKPVSRRVSVSQSCPFVSVAFSSSFYSSTASNRFRKSNRCKTTLAGSRCCCQKLSPRPGPWSQNWLQNSGVDEKPLRKIVRGFLGSKDASQKKKENVEGSPNSELRTYIRRLLNDGIEQYRQSP